MKHMRGNDDQAREAPISIAVRAIAWDCPPEGLGAFDSNSGEYRAGIEART